MSYVNSVIIALDRNTVLRLFLDSQHLKKWIKGLDTFRVVQGRKGKLGIIHLQSAALCICTAFVDEGLQALLPQRVGSWEDIIFDVGAVGFALGVIAILAWGKKIILN